MKKSIPIFTIEQLNACEKDIIMNVDIRRLEVHMRKLSPKDFPHRHNFYNLIYIKKGSGIHNIDFKKFEIEANQLFFMNDGQVHEWILSDDTVGYTLFFKKEFYDIVEKNLSLQALPFFNNNENDVPYVIFEPLQAHFIENIFEEIINEFEKNEIYRDSQIKSLLKIILVHAIRIYKTELNLTPNNLNVSKIRNFQNLIESNFKIEKSVKFYAEKINITANYLNAICKETVGKTAGDMVRDRIILEAKRLLLHSAFSVCEIAYKLGYEDCSYFIRLYKKNTGTTPEKFRILNKKLA
jgi:AraC family transcriptional regulator, transcriptional activator of pobA